MLWGQLAIGGLGVLHAAAAYFYFSRTRNAPAWAAGWLVLAGACVHFLPHAPIATLLVFGLALGSWTLWWASLPALPARDWVVENALQATGEISGDRLVVHNVRNFDWRGRRDFAARWEERHYDLTTLVALDLFVSTWADPRVAHLILSFVFETAPPLAFSIETRRETREKWSGLAGLMKSYELIIIAADERDVIRVRSNVRGERVHRYRIESNPAMRRELLQQYVHAMNVIAERPRYYNTLFGNCTTEIARIVHASGRPVPLDWRLLVSGYVPQYLYRHGLLDRSRPFEALAATADIGARAGAADADPAFWQRIRAPEPLPE